MRISIELISPSPPSAVWVMLIALLLLRSATESDRMWARMFSLTAIPAASSAAVLMR